MRTLVLTASVALSFVVALAPAYASAQGLTCGSCDDCTRALAAAGAEVTLANDLSMRGGACVTVRGEGARFNGAGHVILAQPAGGTGVRVEAADVVVRSLRVTGAAVGAEVARARRVTLYNVVTEARQVGVRVEASADVRLDRVRTTGGRVGVSFGAADDGSCPAGLALRSPGAVLVRSTFERAAVGVAACDARPVLTGNTVARNEVGVALGDPSRGDGPHGDAPWDACACAPELEGMRAGALALFSSGCGGCTVHEGWLPSLRRRGARVVVRETGRDVQAAQRRFDAWMWRCAPGVMDALGIPGCVPNYACAADGAVAKRRENGQLAVEVPLGGEDDVLALAERCAGAARGRFVAGNACVRAALADNTVCGNRRVDLRVAGDPSRWGGLRDRCGTVEAWREGDRPGCSAACDAAAMEVPRVAAEAEPPPAAPAAPAPAVPVVPAAGPQSTASGGRPAAPAGDDNGPLWMAAALVGAAGVGAWLTRRR